MKKKLVRNPHGSRDWLPEEFIKHEYVRKTLVNVFELWGYRPVLPPILINRDSLTIASNSLSEQAFNLIDKQGDILSLRADLTTTVARVTAERLQGEKLPLRFYCVGKVFMYHARKTTNERELFQIGVELIGSKEGYSDLECLKIFYDSMHKLGLKDFLILINHTDVWNELFRCYGDLARALYSALSRKNMIEFKNVLQKSNLPKNEKEFWSELIEIKGKQEILTQLKLINKKAKKVKLEKTISYFKNIFNLFNDSVEVDLSLTTNFDYYTGVYFEAVTSYLGRKVGSGGRYDSLIGKFGYDTPAIGFQFCLEDLLLSLENQNKIFPKFKYPQYIQKKSNTKKTFNMIEKLHKGNKSATLSL